MKEHIKTVVAVLATVLSIITIAYTEKPDNKDNKETITETTIHITETTKAIRTKVKYFDIPLSRELQDYVAELCKDKSMTPSLVYAVMQAESNFNSNASNGKCFGLMQIHKINFNAYGIEDPCDERQNIRAGVGILSSLCDKYQDEHLALMAYNCGEGGAKKLWNRGVFLSSYSKRVVKFKDNIEKECVVWVESPQSRSTVQSVG